MKGAAQLFIALFFLLAPSRPASARDIYPQMLTNWSSGLNASGQPFIAVRGALVGTTAFLLEQSNAATALTAVDVANPRQPLMLGRLILPDAASDLAVSGARAYTVAPDSGLKIFDLTDPANMQLLGQLPLPSSLNVAVSGSYAYVTGSQANLQIIDVSKAAAPRLVSSAAIPNRPAKAVIKDAVAIVPTYGSGIYFIDVSLSATPRVIHHRTANLFVYNAAIKDHFLYYGAERQGLFALDISNPAAPQQVWNLPNSEGAVSIVDNTLYADAWGLTAYDLASPDLPQRTFDWPRGVRGVFGQVGQYALAASYSLAVVDFAVSADPQRIAADIATVGSTDITVDGRFAYASSSTGAVQVIDLSTRTIVAQIGQSAARILKVGRYLYTADPNFQIIDVTDPFAPVIKTTLPDVISVVVSEKRGFVAASGTNGFTILSLTNKSTPTVMGHNGFISWSIAISDNAVYTAPGSGISVFDVSDPANVRNVTNTPPFTTDHEWDLKTRGNYLYSAGSSGLVVLDISNPFVPVKLASTADYFLRRLYLSGDFAYALDFIGALYVYDISDPAHPHQVSGNVSVHGTGLFASDTLYIAGNEFISTCDLYLPDPTALRIRSLNPWNDGTSRVRVNGPPGANIRIERTPDCTTWTTWRNETLGELPIDLADTAASSPLFYRVVIP